MRPPGMSRSAYLRALIGNPYDEAPTHGEAVEILARLAREGKVGAAVALERALRAERSDFDDRNEAQQRLLAEARREGPW